VVNLWSRLKFVLEAGGMVVFLFGLMCLPVGYGNKPNRDLSAFNNFADLGAFIKLGLILMGIGVIAFFRLSCPASRTRTSGTDPEAPPDLLISSFTS
jgi:hypothetical protein